MPDKEKESKNSSDDDEATLQYLKYSREFWVGMNENLEGDFKDMQSKITFLLGFDAIVCTLYFTNFQKIESNIAAAILAILCFFIVLILLFFGYKTAILVDRILYRQILKKTILKS